MTQISRAPAAFLTGPAVPFHVETVGVMVRLRSALAAVVTSVVGGPLAKSRDAQRHFDVDVKLSWQLFRTLGATDPLDVVDHVPARTPFVKLLREARRRHVDPALVDEAERAYDQFEAHVARHAGDRTSFSRMVPGRHRRPGPRRRVAPPRGRLRGQPADLGHRDGRQPSRDRPPPQGRRGRGRSAGSRWSRWRPSAGSAGGGRRPRCCCSSTSSRPRRPRAAEADRPRPLDPDTFAELGVPLVGAFLLRPPPGPADPPGRR